MAEKSLFELLKKIGTHFDTIETAIDNKLKITTHKGTVTAAQSDYVNALPQTLSAGHKYLLFGSVESGKGSNDMSKFMAYWWSVRSGTTEISVNPVTRQNYIGGGGAVCVAYIVPQTDCQVALRIYGNYSGSNTYTVSEIIAEIN